SVAGAGTYTISYTISGSCGSKDSTVISVNAAPTATASGTQTVCSGQAITLSVTTTATNYNWSGPNTFTSNIQNPTISNATTNNSGVYTVTVTANGCTAISSTSVTVINTASVSISPAGPFCSNASATTLSVTSTGSGIWSGTGITNANSGTFNPSVAGAGTHTISYTIGGSCGSADSTVITINAAPTATATGTQTVCSGQAITLSVTTTATSYTWGGPGTFTSN